MADTSTTSADPGGEAGLDAETESEVDAMLARVERRRTALSLLAALAIATLPYREILSGKRTALFGDVNDVHVPSYIEVWRQIGDSTLPWWTPNIFAGHNMVGAGQFAVFYPLNAMFGMFAPVTAHRWWFLAHVWIATAGAFVWALRRWQSRPGAIVAGFGYALSGFLVVHIVHSPYVIATAFFPWMFLGLDMVVERWTPPRVALCSIPFAMVAFSGHPQMVWVSLFGLGVYLLAITIPDWWGTLRGAGAIGVGLGLSALQLVPLWMFSRDSVRPDLDKAAAFDMSEEPRHLLATLFPYIFGGSGMGDEFSAPWLAGPSNFHEVAMYAGITTVALAVIAIVATWGQRAPRALAIVAIASVVFGMGDHTPLGSVFFSFMPLASSFRGWARTMVLLNLMVPVLAALGVREVLRAPRRWVVGVIAGAAAAGALVMIVVRADSVAEAIPPGSYGLIARLFPITLLFALACAVTLMLFSRRAGTIAIIAVCAIDLVTFAYVAPWRSNGLSPEAAAAFYDENNVEFGRPYDAPGGVDRWVTNTYGFRSVSLIKDMEGVNGYDPLLQKEFADTAGGWIYDGYPSRPDLWSEMATADVLRVTTLILAEDITPTGPGWRRTREPIPTAGYIRWERDPALPEAYLVGAVETRTLAEMPAALGDQSVDFESVAFVEDESVAYLQDARRAGEEVVSSDLAESGRIKIDADRDSLLVLSRAWQDGWSATVDGDAAKLVRVNGLVLGVVVPPGEHEVTIAFSPPGVRIGFVIAAIAAFLGFAAAPLIAFLQRRRARPRAVSDERVATSSDG